MITIKEAYPGMCGLIGWIKENDAFCKKNEVWDLQLLQSRLSYHLKHNDDDDDVTDQSSFR